MKKMPEIQFGTKTNRSLSPVKETIGYLSQMPVLLLLIVVFVTFVFLNKRFLTGSNMITIFVSNAFFGIAAIGQVFVLVTGGIDLSIGQVVALSSVVSTMGMVTFQRAVVNSIVNPGAPVVDLAALRTLEGINPNSVNQAILNTSTATILVGLAIALGIGFAVGLINGIAVGKFRVTPFIITLASSLTSKGISYILTKGYTAVGAPRQLMRLSTVMGIPITKSFVVPWAAIIPLVIIVMFGIVLSKTNFGRYVTLVGSNANAARYVGINVPRILISVYTLTGLLAGLAGFMVIMCLGAADPKAGEALLLPIVGAITIGGIRITGGYGNMLHAGLGILLFAILLNGMNYLNFNLSTQQLFFGLILILSTAAMGRLGISARRD
jgi:ribose/xylose/arabinose/galactoside ABC-type transport system permease subunit